MSAAGSARDADRRGELAEAGEIGRFGAPVHSRRRSLIPVLLCSALALRASPAFDAAMGRVRAQQWPEARVALQQVVDAEPRNAAAWFELGRAWNRSPDRDSLEQATRCLAQAVELEPENAKYLAEYGGLSLELAAQTRSLMAALHGRDAMEKSLLLAPDNLDAREGLFQFYSRAPFIAGGSSSKAAAQLAEIRRRDPDRAAVLEVITKTSAKDYAGAFRLCDQVLARDPNNYSALYQYGRTASLAGQQLERALACLQKALTLPQPGPAAPTHSHVWYRIGEIQRRLGHLAEARAAYVAALQSDPSNPQAKAALASLGEQ